MTLAVISKPSAAQQQPQVKKLHVKKGQSHLPTANEKTSQSVSVSKSAFEALCGSRIILEPSCVHALAHQEEAKNLPWTWCALNTTATTLFTLLGYEQATAEMKGVGRC